MVYTPVGEVVQLDRNWLGQDRERNGRGCGGHYTVAGNVYSLEHWVQQKEGGREDVDEVGACWSLETVGRI